MSVHLSIDLDYWYRTKIRPSCYEFIKRVLKLKVPITLYTEHHLILRKVKNNYSKVINVDYHSDISEPFKGWPCCGSWVNFFPGRQNAEFEWRMPDWERCVVEGDGLCHDYHMPQPRKEGSSRNPFTYLHNHKWKKVSRQVGLKNIPWNNIKDVSIVLSIEWSYPQYISKALDSIIQSAQNGQIKLYGKKALPISKRMRDAGKAITT